MTASKDWVRQRRGTRLTGDEATLFSGEILDAKRGLEIGLVDGLGELGPCCRRATAPRCICR